MPLTQTRELIAEYKFKLQDGSLSNEEINELLNPSLFKKSAGYVNPDLPIGNSNFSQWNGMIDFVSTDGPEINPEIFHTVTQRMLELAPSRGVNTFLRNSTLEKAFLAYEMAYFPATAVKHFALERFKHEFPQNSEGFKNFNNVILDPSIEQVINFQVIPDTAQFVLDTNIKLKTLIQLCTNYQDHLKKYKPKNVNNKPSKPSIESKLQIVQSMLEKLQDNTLIDDETRISKMSEILTHETKQVLRSHRSSIVFLEKIIHLLSLGFYSKATKGTFAFWKSHGEVLVDTLEDKISIKPK